MSTTLSNQYQLFSIATTVLWGFGMGAVLVIVWIGWLRTRQPGYVVLGAWALTSAAGMAASYLPTLRMYFGGSWSNDTMMAVMMWTNLIRAIVSSVLLVLGLGMLVFGRRPEQPQSYS